MVSSANTMPKKAPRTSLPSSWKGEFWNSWKRSPSLSRKGADQWRWAWFPAATDQSAPAPVEVGAGGHLVDDLGDGGAVADAAAGDVAVGAKGLDRDGSRQLAAQQARVAGEADVEDGDLDPGTGDALGLPVVGVDEGHALASDHGDGTQRRPDELHGPREGHRFQRGDGHQG